MDNESISPVMAGLLAEFEREWVNLERICAGLSEEDMVAPGAEGEWSVKDILCHISAWEKYLLDRLGMVLTGQPPRYPPMVSWDDVHRFNAQVFIENRDRPLSSVMLEFRNLYQGVTTVLRALNDDHLAVSYSYDFPDDNLNLAKLIRANTSEHYREHCIAIRKEG